MDNGDWILSINNKLCDPMNILYSSWMKNESSWINFIQERQCKIIKQNFNDKISTLMWNHGNL